VACAIDHVFSRGIAKHIILGLPADAARDVRRAARRFGFRRQTNLHPAEPIDDTRVAAAGILTALARSLARSGLQDIRRTLRA